MSVHIQSRELPRVVRLAAASIILVMLGARSVPAQTHAEPVFARLLVARFDTLARDTAIGRLTGAKDGLALVGAIKPDALGRIDDAALLDFRRAAPAPAWARGPGDPRLDVQPGGGALAGASGTVTPARRAAGARLGMAKRSATAGRAKAGRKVGAKPSAEAGNGP